jgi:RHS repeat-associated protein
VYSCNNSEAIVRTDNLLVVHYTGRLLEEFHYYPFGLCFEVSKSPALEKSSEQRYNSQFIQQDEFVDGNGQTYGLEDYDFAFRNYDPQIGRWMQPDPLMQHASPYLAMSNNPVLFTDPSGLYDLNEVVITADRPYWMSYEGYFDSPGQNPFDRSNLMADMVYENGAKYRKADQVTDVFGKVQNHGTAYGRGNYWANELASREIQKNNGFNSKLIASIGGGSWDFIGDNIGILGTGLKSMEVSLYSNAKSFATKYSTYKNTGRINGVVSSATMTRYGKIASASAGNFAKSIGTKLGVLGGFVSMMDAGQDGVITKGDVFKVAFSFGTMIPYVGTTIGFIDLGMKLTTGKGLSDLGAEYLDK